MNGIFPDLSHADYHAMTDIVSNSYLSRLAICPAAAKVPQEETPAMTFGRALHSFILDGPDAFSRDVAIEPEVNKRTNEGKATLAAFQEANKGKAIITTEDLESIKAMDKSVKSHPTASRLIGSGTNEVSVFWDDSFSGLPCKCRPDIVPGEIQGTLIDLKKTRDASPHGFARSVTSFGYHRQACFYMEGMSKASGKTFDVFAFIAVEEKEPYRVGVYTLSPAFIDRGGAELKILLTQENNCRQKGEWPNYTEAGVTELEMPKWMAYQDGEE